MHPPLQAVFLQLCFLELYFLELSFLEYILEYFPEHILLYIYIL